MDPTKETPDARLAALASRGSDDAFEQLVRRYARAIQLLAERATSDHHLALDLTQEIWIKVHRALPRFRPEGSFRSWLFSIALNHIRDAGRSRARSRLVYLDEFRRPPLAPKASDPSGRTEEHAAIAAAVEKIPEPYRTSLLLIDVLRLTYEEAAFALGTRVGTVKSRVNRGRLQFRDHYQKLCGEGDSDQELVSRPIPGVAR